MSPPYHCGVVESAGRWLPLNLLYLAHAARAAGHQVEVYDAMTLGHDLPEIERRLRGFGPDVVGVGAITASLPASLEVLGLAKWSGSPVTILGGVHGSFMFREILEAPDCPADFIVRGEGEATLPELLDCLAAGDDPGKVPGLAFRRAGETIATPPRPLAPSLDGFSPAWDLVNWEDYTYFPLKGSRLAAVSTSRGCPHACTFCSQQKIWERTWRARPPADIVRELELLAGEYGVDVVLVADEYPTRDRERWKLLLEQVAARRLGIKFLIETRVSDIVRDRDLLGLYAEAGIIHVYVGVEAAEQSALDKLGKELRVEDSALALRLLDEAGMVTETSFVLGLPGETPETVRRTLDAARAYDPDFAHFLLIAPWPYADIHSELEPLIETEDYGEYNLVSPVARSLKMSRAELQSASVECYRKFYMGKLPAWFSMQAGFKKDYLLDSMRLILKSSFLKKHMRGLGGIPAEIERHFSLLRV